MGTHTCSAGLIDAFRAGQVAQRELAARADPARGVRACAVDDERAVRAAGVRVDVVAADRALLVAGRHQAVHLPRGSHVCMHIGHTSLQPLLHRAVLSLQYDHKTARGTGLWTCADGRGAEPWGRAWRALRCLAQPCWG